MVVARRKSGRAVALVAAAGVSALLAMSACTTSTSSSGEVDAATRPPTTTAITEPAPTTTAPTTTARPSTTVRRTTTTTAAPTTTEAPRPAPSRRPQRPRPRPERPAPANIVPIAPLDVPLASVGSSGGSETARLQQRLLDLGFWLSGADGVYGLTTRQAVMAFQKYLHLSPTGEVDDATAAYLSGIEQRAHGWADAGTLVEVDKTRQLLFLVVDGKTQWVFNTSTGNGETYTEPDKNSPGEMVEGVALTPDGLHSFYREKPEGWWEGDLGQLYRPKYFAGGVAVHGSNSVPNYPASHGCVRVTTEAMDFIWDSGIMPIGLPVLVHQEQVA